MSTLRRPDTANQQETTRARWRYWSGARTLATALLLALVPSIAAQVDSPQRAIEALEGCSKKERSSGCITILKREAAGAGKQAIKAQVRGGRIIWYEYDKKSGAVRRTN